MKKNVFIASLESYDIEVANEGFFDKIKEVFTSDLLRGSDKFKVNMDALDEVMTEIRNRIERNPIAKAIKTDAETAKLLSNDPNNLFNFFQKADRVYMANKSEWFRIRKRLEELKKKLIHCSRLPKGRFAEIGDLKYEISEEGQYSDLYELYRKLANEWYKRDPYPELLENKATVAVKPIEKEKAIQLIDYIYKHYKDISKEEYLDQACLLHNEDLGEDIYGLVDESPLYELINPSGENFTYVHTAPSALSSLKQMSENTLKFILRSYR